MEKRKYGPDSTEAEIELIKSRVKLLESGIISFNEAPVLSEFQMDVMWGEVEKLIIKNEDNYLLVDLANTVPPNAKQRAIMKERIRLFSQDVKYAGLYTEQNKLINLVAKFMLGGAGLMGSSIHVTREQALKAIEDVRSE